MFISVSSQLLSLVVAPLIFVPLWTLGFVLSSYCPIFHARNQPVRLGRRSMAIAIVTGNWALSTILFPFGLLGGIGRTESIAIFSFVCVACIFIFGKFARNNCPSLSRSELPSIAIYGLLLLPLILTCALPEVGWDALAYHVPPVDDRYRINLVAGLYSALPKGLDILFWWSERLTGNLTVARLFHLSYLFAMGLYGHDFLAKRFSPLAAWLFPVICATHYIAFQYAASCYIDYGTACLEFMAILTFCEWIETNEAYLLRSSAFLIGMALAIKYTALPLALILTGCVTCTMVRAHNRRIDFAGISVVALCALLPEAVWYVKNLIIYGNFVWPFYFGHRGMKEIDYRDLMQDNLGHFRSPLTLLNFLAHPWRLFTGNYMGYDAGLVLRSNYYLGAVGAVVAFAFRSLRSNKVVFWMASIFALTISFNFWFGSHQERYVLGAWYLGFLLFCVAFDRLKPGFFWPVIMVVATAMCIQAKKHSAPMEGISVLLIDRDIEGYLSRSLYDYDLTRMAHAHRLKSAECGYMFEFMARGYMGNWWDLKEGFSTKVGLTESNEKAISLLQRLGVRYWLRNEMATDIRRPWFEERKNMDEELRNQIRRMVEIDDYIAVHAKKIDQNGRNQVFDLSSVK